MRPKKEINVQVGEQIKKAREKNGLTQEQFAEMIDKTPQFVSDLERGVCGISLETLSVICRRLNVSSDSLLFPDRSENDVERISELFRRMTPEQLRVMEALAGTFVRVFRTLEDEKIQ